LLCVLCCYNTQAHAWKQLNQQSNHQHNTNTTIQFEWRNGYFASLSHTSMRAGEPDPCPLHTALLKEVCPELVPELK
jgi:hypothetical protein